MCVRRTTRATAVRIMYLLLLRSILPSVSMFCSEQMKSGAGGSSTQRDGVLAAVNLSQQKSSRGFSIVVSSLLSTVSLRACTWSLTLSKDMIETMNTRCPLKSAVLVFSLLSCSPSAAHQGSPLCICAAQQGCSSYSPLAARNL